MEENKKKKLFKVLKIVGNVFFWCFVGSLVVFALVNGIDQHSGYKAPFFGYRKSVITSDSMSEVNEVNTYITEDMTQIQKYDVVTTKNYKSYEDIELYDVLTYYSDSNGLICHRVIDKYEDNGEQYLVTRGDANSVDDEPINYSLVRGKVVSVHKGTGHIVAFVQSGYFILALCLSIFFVCLGIFIFDFTKKGKKKEEVQPVEETPHEEVEEQPQEEIEKDQKKNEIN